jgi:hypothetical protein
MTDDAGGAPRHADDDRYRDDGVLEKKPYKKDLKRLRTELVKLQH